MRFTKEQLEKIKQIREENPELAAWVDEIRQQFPGSKLVYLKSGDFEVGEKSEGGVVPYIDPEVLRRVKENAKPAHQTFKPKTVAEKRRALMKYKE